MSEAVLTVRTWLRLVVSLTVFVIIDAFLLLKLPDSRWAIRFSFTAIFFFLIPLFWPRLKVRKHQ
jgi:hypothetical protein